MVDLSNKEKSNKKEITNIDKKVFNNMDDNKLRGWENWAVNRPDLRYPKIDLIIIPPNKEGILRMVTFVSVKDKLTLIEDSFHYSASTDIWNMLPILKERFINRCEMVKDKYIFKSNNSIKDPYK